MSKHSSLRARENHFPGPASHGLQQTHRVAVSRNSATWGAASPWLLHSHPPLSPGQHSYRTSREETEAARAAGSQVSAIMAVCGSGSTVCPLYHLMPSVCAYLYLNDSVLSVRMTQQRVSIQQTFVAKRKAINKQTGSRCEVFPHFWSLQPSMCTGN